MIEITVTSDMDCAELSCPGKRVELSAGAHGALEEALADLFARHGGEYSTVKEIAFAFGTSKRDMNSILNADGWQVRIDGKWAVTPKGFKDGKANIKDGRIFWSYDAVHDLLFGDQQG